MARALYVSSLEFKQYAADRGVIVSDSEALPMLNRAQDYINTIYQYKGTSVNGINAFPRKGLCNYADDVIPEAVIEATLYAALQIKLKVPFLEGALADPQIKSRQISLSGIKEEMATNYKASPVQESVPLQMCTSLLANADLLARSPYGIVNMDAFRG